MRPDNYVLPYVTELNRVVNDVQNIIDEVNIINKHKKNQRIICMGYRGDSCTAKNKRIPPKTFESPTCSLLALIIYGMI